VSRAICVLALALLAALRSASGLAADDAVGFKALKPDDIRWTQRRSAPDVFYAAIYGDPAQSGPYAYRVRAEAGHVLAPHTHPDERTITVLSGTYWAGVGERFEQDKLGAFPAGSFYVIPAGMPHYSAVLEGEVVFQESGTGPSRVDMLPAH